MAYGSDEDIEIGIASWKQTFTFSGRVEMFIPQLKFNFFFFIIFRVGKMECESKNMFWKHVLFYVISGKGRLAGDSFTNF